MSFLNALASSGLTVGLRLAQANYFPRVNSPEAPAAPADRRPAEALAPASGPRETRPEFWPLSPEERAAGRAEARAQLAAEGVLGRLIPGCGSVDSGSAPSGEVDAEEEAVGSASGGAVGSGGQDQGPLKKMTPEEEAQVRKLGQRDQEVKAHEQAHVAASGGLAGAPQYKYQTGPDGRQYAVGGQVSIRRGGSADTGQALQEAQAVKRGALAPAQPSSQDMAVAAQADADIQRLQAKKIQEEREKTGASAPGAPGLVPAAQGSARLSKAENSANGAAFGLQAAGAYVAIKFGFQSAVHPLLALA